MKILITGAAGFIGSLFVEYFLQETNWDIVILDKFTYASNGLARLKEVKAYDNPRVKIYVADIARLLGHCLEKEIGPVDYFLHMAAATHVDNSIACPRDFIEANIMGTFEMLEYARRIPGLKKFIYFSTDEVFGPAAPGQKFSEWDRYNSCNPYAAAKAGGEELALAWANTYKVPVIISHTMNVMGIRQHPEKFIPRVIRAALMGEIVQVHTDPNTKLPGSRTYLSAQDVAHAIMLLLEKGVVREKYNIAGTQEISNFEIVQEIGKILGLKIPVLFVNPTSIRPGFDIRYGVSGEKMKELGWKAPMTFEQDLRKVVEWSVRAENLHWLELGHG